MEAGWALRWDWMGRWRWRAGQLGGLFQGETDKPDIRWRRMEKEAADASEFLAQVMDG